MNVKQIPTQTTDTSHFIVLGCIELSYWMRVYWILDTHGTIIIIQTLIRTNTTTRYTVHRSVRRNISYGRFDTMTCKCLGTPKMCTDINTYFK